jgi:hypothetical protein
MFYTPPAPAKSFSINTNTRDLKYDVDTQRMLKIIRDNPQGLTLKEIALKIDSKWDSKNCSRMFKQAIDPLCARDQVRFTEDKGKRDKYYPVTPSKRWIITELLKQLTSN